MYWSQNQTEKSPDYKTCNSRDVVFCCFHEMFLLFSFLFKQISKKYNSNTDTVFVNCTITVLFFYEKF